MTADVTISIDLNSPQKPISKFIFGINDGANYKKVSPKAVRLGGNRMTAYNWENNKSNAGSDWYFQTDDYMIRNVRPELKRTPGGAALNVSQDALQHNVPYKLLTLQMAGYVANKDGKKTEDNPLDGDDWCKIINRKGSDFSLKPDKTDGVVYTDEYLNYLGTVIGKSDTPAGFQGYALDNEPKLWNHTHKLIQKNPVSAKELISRSVDLASTVKDFDSNAEVFGPSLFGYSAYDSLGQDWTSIKVNSLFRYNWFIDYYLEEMKKAGDLQNRRLLDVLDLHYYTEAKGACGIRKCTHYDNDECIKARINSVRSLFDANYKEKSWITDNGAKYFPLLPKLMESIEKFYPGTKLGFTEYNFGGGTDITGAIAQSDFLGVLMDYEVYFASIWAFDNAEYQFAAINMFTDYDGKNGYFGDYLIKSDSSDDYKVSVYSAKNLDDGKIHVILINKEIHEKSVVSINLGTNEYKSAENYILDNSGTAITKADNNYPVKKGELKIALKPLSINHLVLNQ